LENVLLLDTLDCGTNCYTATVTVACGEKQSNLLILSIVTCFGAVQTLSWLTCAGVYSKRERSFQMELSRLDSELLMCLDVIPGPAGQLGHRTPRIPMTSLLMCYTFAIGLQLASYQSCWNRRLCDGIALAHSSNDEE